MKDVDRAAFSISAVLAAVAGYVDAIGFLDTGGLFVSFMSGNSTQAAVEILSPGATVVLASAGIIVAFVAGVTVGGVATAFLARPRAWIVAGSSAGVAVVAALSLAGEATVWRVAVLAAAMGALNTLFLADGRARVAITYSTGTLVSLGLAIAEAVTGGSRRAWRRPLLLWSSLVCGAIVGAVAHGWGSPLALSLAAVALAVVSVVLATRRAGAAP